MRRFQITLVVYSFVLFTAFASPAWTIEPPVTARDPILQQWDASQGRTSDRALKLHRVIHDITADLANAFQSETEARNESARLSKERSGEILPQGRMYPQLAAANGDLTAKQCWATVNDELAAARRDATALAERLSQQPDDLELAAELRTACFDALMLHLKECWRLTLDTSLEAALLTRMVWLDQQQYFRDATWELRLLTPLLSRYRANQLVGLRRLRNWSAASVAASYRVAVAEGDTRVASDLKRFIRITYEPDSRLRDDEHDSEDAIVVPFLQDDQQILTLETKFAQLAYEERTCDLRLAFRDPVPSLDAEQSLRLVQLLDGIYQPAGDELHFWEPFYVEMEYPEPPDMETSQITLELPASENCNVTLHRTPGASQLYRSERMCFTDAELEVSESVSRP